MTPIPLYEMFPFLENHAKLAADYAKARVVSVSVKNGNTQMEITLSIEKPAPPMEIAAMESLILQEYSMKTVNIQIAMSEQKPEQGGIPEKLNKPEKSGIKTSTEKPKDREASGSRGDGGTKVIIGRAVKTEPKPIGEIQHSDSKVTVRGDVCNEQSKYIERRKSWLLSFDITDYTGTINVSKFLDDDKAEQITGKVKKGMHLTVSGTISINKFDGEMTLNPQSIFISDKEEKMDTSEKKRVELHLHTKMSTDGLISVDELLDRAVKWGHPAVAITDHGVVHAFPDALDAAAKRKNKVKVIYGVEGYLSVNPPDDALPKQKKTRNFHVILLVKNKTGLKHLYEIISKSHTKHFRKRPIIYKDVLKKRREGLIIGSACERGELFEAIKDRAEMDRLVEIAQFYDYLEIQPISNNMFMLHEKEPKASSVDDLRAFNERVIEVGRALNLPVVATTDAHFLDPEQEIFRKIILHGRGYSTADDDLPLYYRTTDEMLEEFSYLGEETAFEVVVTNTNKIADMCEAISPLPPKKKLYPPKLEGSAQELEDLILKRIPELYGDNPHEIITERVDYELQDILQLKYDVIYMTAQKLVAFLKSQGSIVGSRGSVGSSFVAYLAGITEVNPLKAHYRCPICKNCEFSEGAACGPDLPDKNCPACGSEYIKDGFNIRFETFMGFGGDKVPDIDLNISGWYFNIAQDFVYGMFGKKHVFRAGTIGTIAGRTAYGLVKKYLEHTNRTVTKAEENRLVAGCLGVKQTTGQHPGGLIVIPQDMEVTDFCPIQYPADDKEKGVITTHFDYHKMEDNLIKLDILGQDNPTMLLALEEMTGIKADDVRLDDPDTMSIFSSPERLGLPLGDEIIGETGTIGIPEFGTQYVRQMLCDTRPRDFDTLIRLSGYSHGEKVWQGNAQDLIKSGKVTVAETISSRDDIMLYLISKGMADTDAFAISESVRKDKGFPKKYEQEARSLKIPQWYVDSCNKIGYLFPKAHAVAYVMMAFRIAWFKVHWPLEYFSAHFYRRSQNGHFDAHSMTQGIDAVRKKIRETKGMVKNLSELPKKEQEMLATLESCYEFYILGYSFAKIDLYESDAEKFLLVDSGGGKGILRPPLVAVSGLGEAAALSIAQNREGRKFISIEDFSSACPGVNKNHIEQLRELGALADLPDSSQISLF